MKTVPVVVGTPVKNAAGKQGRWESLAIVGSALVFGALSVAWSCQINAWCTADGTCQGPITNTSWLYQCSFRTNVPLISDLAYSNYSTTASLAALTRGLCGVGERLHSSSLTGEPTCTILRPYPDALNAEVMDVTAATDHGKACGSWIAGGAPVNVEYLSFSGGTERAEAIKRAASSTYASARASSTNLGKFHAACQRAVLGDTAALRASAEIAYKHLVKDAAITDVVDETTALNALGIITGHYCDSPILFGWTVSASGFSTTRRAGMAFTKYALSSAMHLVRRSIVSQAEAEQANEHINLNAWTSPVASAAQYASVLSAASGRPDVSQTQVQAYGFTPEFDGFVHLIAENNSISKVRSYLHGLAAMCSFSLEAMVDTPGYTATGAHEWLSHANQNRPKAAALGALQPPANYAPMFELSETADIDSSTIVISQLVGASSTSTRDVCSEFARMMFPDEHDALYFDLVVPPTLYDRMHEVVQAMKTSVATVLRQNSAIRATLADPDSVASQAENVRFRIPGAPRGSWAGATRPTAVASLSSIDGVFVMALKQARALYLDRQGSLAFDATTVCEGPAAYSSLTQNAYIYFALRCSFYLLGMSTRPYADSLYSNESLASRFGAIVAHEIAHTTLTTTFVQPQMNTLLQSYPNRASTNAEAIADVVGLLGVLESGYQDNSTRLCQHWSQAWCARTPIGYDLVTGNSHPLANTRGDAGCQTMRDLGA